MRIRPHQERANVLGWTLRLDPRGTKSAEAGRMPLPVRSMSRLSEFIRENVEPILEEWESFARSLPAAEAMDVTTLRDHARQMLEVIATDLDTPQSAQQQLDKGQGRADALGTDDRSPRTAAQEHGAGRAEHGFNVSQMVAEFRALRASVIRLWSRTLPRATLSDLEDLTRFNEAIDQAIAESITRFTQDIGDAKERFLAILAHDLRTPLSSIITSSKFMVDNGELREPNVTLVQRIGTSARRMNQMVLDLLDFTRTRFGDSMPVVRSEVDARRVMHDVIAEVAATYPSARVHLETSGDLHGRWDGDRLTQAMTNLIANAAQLGFDKSPIVVVARGLDHEVEITVQNEGPVIPRDQVGQIFQAMKHTKADATRDRRHLGLGLYIVDKVVEAHGGSVDVQSSKDRGTTFTLRLPRR
jgi:signal transduction histidine kinase